MQFTRIDAADSTGNILPLDENGNFRCQWTNNVSQIIMLIPVIDDEGEPQQVRLKTKIEDRDFYEFSSGDPFEINNHFSTGEDFSFSIRVRRKPQPMTSPPCDLFNTLFFTINDGEEEKKRQRSQHAFIM